MSKPFIIWTMRRTGGTSLTTLLTDISEYNGIQHEPFNQDRVLGGFIKKFRAGVPIDEIEEGIRKVFLDKPLIKHCYELFGKEFNKLIVDTACEQEYKHIFLRREDEVSRIVSLFLAQQTSVWGPEQKREKYQNIISGKEALQPFNIEKMVEHYKWCNTITHYIQNILEENAQEYKVISFENFYTGTREARLKNLYELFDYLEFEHVVREQYKDKIEEKIFHSSQNSKSILEYVPNYQEAIKKLHTISKI